MRKTGRAKEDYHRYVFRNGRLVGEFERMYRECTVVPWGQDQTVDLWWTDVALRLLELSAPYSTAIDVGCGLGYFTNKCARLCRKMLGVDVSPTAMARASTAFPHLKFRVFDVREPAGRVPAYNLVVAKEIIWYVFPQIEVVVRNLTKMTAPGGVLFLCQSFPNLQRPFVGKEVIASPDELVGRFQGGFELEQSVHCQEFSRPQDGPLYMALLRRKTRK